MNRVRQNSVQTTGKQFSHTSSLNTKPSVTTRSLHSLNTTLSSTSLPSSLRLASAKSLSQTKPFASCRTPNHQISSRSSSIPSNSRRYNSTQQDISPAVTNQVDAMQSLQRRMELIKNSPNRRELALHDVESILPTFTAALSMESDYVKIAKTRLGTVKAELEAENRFVAGDDGPKTIKPSDYFYVLDQVLSAALYETLTDYQQRNNYDFALSSPHAALESFIQVIRDNDTYSTSNQGKFSFNKVSSRRQYMKALDNLFITLFDISPEEFSKITEAFQPDLVNRIFYDRLIYSTSQAFIEGIAKSFKNNEIFYDTTHLQFHDQRNRLKTALIGEVVRGAYEEISDIAGLPMPFGHVFFEMELVFGFRLPVQERHELVIRTTYAHQKLAKMTIHPLIAQEYFKLSAGQVLHSTADATNPHKAKH